MPQNKNLQLNKIITTFTTNEAVKIIKLHQIVAENKK